MNFYEILSSAEVGKTFVRACGIGTLELTKLSDYKCLVRVFFCLAGFEESLDSVVSATNTCTIMEAASMLNECSSDYGD